MRSFPPLRFVVGVVGVWAVARVLVLSPDLLTAPAEADAPAVATVAGSVVANRPERRAMASPVPPRSGAESDAEIEIAPRRELAGVSLPAAIGRGARPSLSPTVATAPGPLLSPTGQVSPAPLGAAAPPAALDRAASGSGAPAAGAALAVAPSRWSGGVYLYRRGEGGVPALATGGQLGGSQAGARIARAIGPARPTRIAVAARLATPLDEPRGAEAAAGIDLHPLPGRPLRVSIERRVDLGGAGRNAWSAYAAGGFWRPLGRSLVADGYAQAGVVGARSGDLFADGALRLGHRRELAGGRALTLGAGAWGAAQPRVERLDVGPRAALSLPLGPSAVTLAAEWRVRVAGAARPGSGLALTLASDF